MEIAYISIKNTDVLDGNLIVHLLIMSCYQKCGIVLCTFPSIHNVHVYNRCEMQAPVYSYVHFRNENGSGKENEKETEIKNYTRN